MSHHHTRPTPVQPPAPPQQPAALPTSAIEHPPGRYCGHVFLYWDPDHFRKAAAAGGASWHG
ncbi:MAG: hypothetical protein R6W66_03280 [Pelovirga sp.]